MNKLLLLISILFATHIQAAQTPDGNYKLDKAHAHIGFKVSHLGFSHVFGRFNKFDGKVNYVAGGTSNIEFTIQTKSIDTNNRKRDDHLRSSDFFDVDLYDTITFKSTAVNYTDGDPNQITGLLTLKGVEKAVVFEVKPIGAGESRGKAKAGYEATTTIDRTDFDMGGFSTIGESIEIIVNLEMEKVN